MSRILPLPPEAVSQIHSSKHITDLQGVAVSLLENSLDAESTKVEISLDFRRGNCTVEDNGLGIPAAEFADDGGLGRMYHTSKRGAAVEHDLHGHNGTYLAQLAALSLLGITSQHTNHDMHSTLTIHQGKIVGRYVPAPPADELLLSRSHGTRVIVRDLFGNMPVRVKQRALATDSGNDDEKAWQELKRGVVALLLAWRKPCSVRVKDVECAGRSLTLSGHHPIVSTALTEKSLNHLAGKATKFELKDVLPILTQSGFIHSTLHMKWIPVSASTPKFTVKGVICFEPAPTKHGQFISIGIHPCSPSSGYSELYDSVNKVFTNSSFGSIGDEPDLDETEQRRRQKDRRYKSDGYTRKQLHGRKGVDRWPTFVLQIKASDHGSHDATNEKTSDSFMKAFTEILEATVRQWLMANHFRPQKSRRRRNESQQSPSAAEASSRSTSADISLRSGTNTPTVTPLKRASALESATTSKRRRFVDFSGNVHSIKADDALATSVPNGAFNTWSRIKAGRRDHYDENRCGRKPATAPAGQTGSALSLVERPRPTFRVPTLLAGELSAPQCVTHSNRPSSTHKPASALDMVEPGHNLDTSSDYFGSLEDCDVLAAVEAAEDERKIQLEHATPTGSQNMDPEAHTKSDLTTDWTDPTTKQVFKVNVRTGVVIPHRLKPASDDNEAIENPARPTAAVDTSMSSLGRPLGLARRATTPAIEAKSNWLPGFLKEWSNPVFARQDQEPIPVASFEGPGIDPTDTATRRRTHHARTEAFAGVGTAGTSKLTKEALKTAQVLRQIDGKFILCKTSTASGESLILVDQHAASERVILETLLDDLCAAPQPSSGSPKSRVDTTPLLKPLRYEISATEFQLFREHEHHFADWGLLYELDMTRESLSASQVREARPEHYVLVKALPPTISERCTLLPTLLIELLRSELWAVTESAKRTRPGTRTDTANHQSSHQWLGRIGSCPKGILDMLNSRACRSAIMFNDQLSVPLCEELLADLSKCAFPFMCAHGRVSMVPLVELGGGDDGIEVFGSVQADPLDGPNKCATSYTSAFKGWSRPSNEQ